MNESLDAAVQLIQVVLLTALVVQNLTLTKKIKIIEEKVTR